MVESAAEGVSVHAGRNVLLLVVCVGYLWAASDQCCDLKVMVI